ncbi:MAG: ABC transporter permease [Ekhidna sp.]
MDWLLECYCSKALLEDLQGDLHEYYDRNIKKGRFWADFIFLLDVIKFFRPYTIRKLKLIGHMTFLNLMGNYFKTSIRSIARNKLFSSINIVGLAISMSVGLIMIAYLTELTSFDKFHEKKERIYRVISIFQERFDDSFDLASTSIFIGDQIRENISGVDKVLIIRRNFNEDLEKEDNVINVRGHYASEEFFDVFSFKLIAGDPATALKEPESIVLTESTAQKLFGDKNPVGETVTNGETSFTVTGVMEDVPSNSHIDFEVLCSLSTQLKAFAQEEGNRQLEWGSIWANHVYVLLNEDSRPENLKEALNEIATRENATREVYSIKFDIQNLAEITPGRDLSNQIGNNITWDEIFQLSILTVIIILSACFNYKNLSIARAFRRAKEVGVRKIVGASRSNVMFQFILEAMLIAIFALIISFGIFSLIKPAFISIVADGQGVDLNFNWYQVPYFILFAMSIGLIAGWLPSLVISRLKAISILGDVTKLRIMKGVSLRKVLIVLQFAISMTLIITATIAYRQYVFSLNYDLGYKTDNIINVDVLNNDIDLLETEFSKIAEVKQVSRSAMITSAGSIWGANIKYQNPLDSVRAFVNWVDKDYVDMHEFKFLAGENFPHDSKGDPSLIIIDENMSRALGFESPDLAVGETVTMVRSRREDFSLLVTGVIENYQYTDLATDLEEPTILVNSTEYNITNLNLLVNTDNVFELMDKIEGAWSQVDKVHPFEGEFHDQQIAEHYAQYRAMFNIFAFLGFIAITISGMGLLGIAVFTTETRLKEISVRKVLGATEKSLVFILSRSFLFMLGISALLAIPVSYFFMKDLILEEFTKRIPVGAAELLPGVLLIIVIGFLTIGWQTIRAARTNPAEMLRDE